MHFCHHHLSHHRTTVLDSVLTHFSYLNAQHIFLTVIFNAYVVQALILVLVIVSRLFLVFLSAFILLVCVLSRLIYNKMMIKMMMMMMRCR